MTNIRTYVQAFWDRQSAKTQQMMWFVGLWFIGVSMVSTLAMAIKLVLLP